MSSPQSSLGVDAPERSAPSGFPRPPVDSAVLTELRDVQRTLDHGAIVALKRVDCAERADQLDLLAAQLCQAAVVCASSAGSCRAAARLRGEHGAGG